MNDNQAICLKCGVMVGTGKSFCHNCGSAVAEEAVICVHCGVSLKKEGTDANAPNLEGIKKRSIVTAVLLSLVTCGIYAIYWFISLTNEMNKASGKPNDTNGGMAFLLSLVTCGIYEYFWAYKLGEKRDIVAKENGSSNIIYLLLLFFGLGIVVYGLAQDALNKAIDNQQ
ncbi:MAG: DUF4234 domain-containing protein [Clostridia bacterium]|nr:DUF4234 domain-containing protein [Clostridia bacterium]